jgi:hypothetical protein
MAAWGWHSYADALRPEELARSLRLTPYDTWGRKVLYPADDSGQSGLFYRIRQSAHKFHLGRLAFVLAGAKISPACVTGIRQTLSLWDGVLISNFSLRGYDVGVETLVHPNEDTLCVRVRSQLIARASLKLELRFPYGSHKKAAGEFESESVHSTELICAEGGFLRLHRKMDETEYDVDVIFKGCHPEISIWTNRTLFISSGADVIELCIRFMPCKTGVMCGGADAAGLFAEGRNGTYPSFDRAKAECSLWWNRWWRNGAAVSFEGSKDERAGELERRIVLSQYLFAIQERGVLPPAETGLSCNSWYGKFHLEMHYWHSAHFALWARPEELSASLEYYKLILGRAKEIAASQGYKGARWPKMCDPSGFNTPSSIAVLLIWQQAHPVLLAELCAASLAMLKGEDAAREFIARFEEVLTESAVFMLDFLHYDEERARYVLGPPYIPAQERHDPRLVLNAVYEVEYFRYGLRAVNRLLARLGKPPREEFEQAAALLAAPALHDGLYSAHENCPETFSKLPFYTDHPSMLAACGVLAPSEALDLGAVARTLDKVLEVWDKSTFYGWDFPMLALTAAALGRKEQALDLLLMESPKNTWLANGHNKMTGDDALPLYLPGNGGLLIAVAVLAKKGLFPEGFNVQAEGFSEYLW